MKIARIATVPFFLYSHLREQIAATAAAGHEIVLISSAGPETEWLRTIPGVRFTEIDIPRKIAPLRDLRALWRLFLFFRRERFDIVHSTTPKAGMLCAVAGWLARVPIRLHTFTGQAWVELGGMARLLAKGGDWLTAHLDTQCYADSFSQRDFIVSEAVGTAKHIHVLRAGSLAGVDLARFDLDRWAGGRVALRRALNIPEGAKVIAFVGRLTRDKGMGELMAAFNQVSAQLPCVLLLIGPNETADGSLSHAAGQGQDENVRLVGYTPEPERYLAISDLLCLPSYREGFGNVVIEAAAMGVPSVGTDIVGLRDAIVNGETGVLVPPRDVASLAEAMLALLTDDARRRTMGERARQRAVSAYDAATVNAAVLAEYRRLAGR
ncbi:MAG TPA: glycosyltransferase family 4 protein [Gallionellaceae bacterium]|nr:glycosyltransferase family 4 protein [Gallionellaceae bacterium]